jgi:hypothetical protein
MPRSTRQGCPRDGGGCDGVGPGVPAGDDDVTPDGVGAGDTLCTGDGLGAAVPDARPGEGAVDGIAPGAAVWRGSRPLAAGRGPGEWFGDVLVAGLGARAWTWPALGSPLALDGA